MPRSEHIGEYRPVIRSTAKVEDAAIKLVRQDSVYKREEESESSTPEGPARIFWVDQPHVLSPRIGDSIPFIFDRYRERACCQSSSDGELARSADDLVTRPVIM
jgi:hypothetical protein